MKLKSYGIFCLLPSKALKQALSFLLISIFPVHFTWAAAEFLPKGGDEAKMTKQIISELPFIGAQGPNQTYFARMREGLQALRKEFKDFDKWSAEKPNPITILISKNVNETIRVSALSNDQLKVLLPQVQAQVNSYVAKLSGNRKVATPDDLRQLALNHLVESVLQPNEGPRGILTGLIQVLPGPQRAEIFKAGDPAEQIRLLRKSGLTDADLKVSSFRAEVAGLSQKELSVARVLDIATERLNSSQSIVSVVATYRYISLLSSDEIESLIKGEKISKTPAKVLTSIEAGFLESANSEAAKEISKMVAAKKPDQASAFQKALSGIFSQIPKSAFTTNETVVKTSKPYVKVIEVHPYMAYFRGCVGGDCSTSTSPMFPMSPWEHVFFIQTPNGEFSGYISATRVIVDGEPTFYLKDISGSALSPTQAEIVLNAFEKVYPYYGVKKFAIASSEFTKGQNHFYELINMLAKYNRKDKERDLKFIDENIREFIGNTNLFGSSYYYDNPDMHSKAVFFVPNSDVLKEYTVVYQPGSLTAFKPSTSRESVMFALNLLAADPKANLSDVPKVSEAEMKNLFAMVENRTGVSLEQHYAALNSAFARYEIELSRSFRHSNDLVFSEGHLRAADAMATKNESLLSDSERFFTNYVRRHGDIGLITKFVAKWNGPLSRSKKTAELIDLLTERADPRDVVYLMLFADAGLEAAKKSFASAKVKSRLPEAITRFAEGRGIRRGSFSDLPKEVLNYRLFRFETLAKSANGLTSLAFSREVQQLLASFGLDQKALKDAHFAKWYEGNLLRTKDAFTKDRRATGIAWLQKNAVQSPETIFEVLILQSGLLQKEEFAESYIKSLKAQPTEANFMRVYALAQAGYPAAKLIVSSESGRAALLRMANQMAETAVLGSEAIAVYQSAKNLGAFTNNPDFLDRFVKFVRQNSVPRSVADLYREVEKLTKPFNFDFGELLMSQAFLNRMTKQHLAAADAFTTKNTIYLGYTLRFFAKSLITQISSDDDIAIQDAEERKQAFLDNVENFYKVADYTSFIRFLTEQPEKDCAPCAEILHDLIHSEAIADYSIFSTKKLRSLIGVRFYGQAMTMAASELVRRGEKVSLDDQAIQEITHQLADISSDDERHPDTKFEETIFRLLVNRKIRDHYALQNIRRFVESTNKLRYAYKAAAIYVQAGGDVEEIDENIRDAKKELAKRSSSTSPETLHWAEQYEAVKKDQRIVLVDYAPKIRTISCKNLISSFPGKK